MTLPRMANTHFLAGLMEENGIKREAGDDSKPSKLDSMSSGSGSKDDNEKPSMKDRIKDKLHLHKS